MSTATQSSGTLVAAGIAGGGGASPPGGGTDRRRALLGSAQRNSGSGSPCGSLEVLSWHPAHCEQSLEVVYYHVRCIAQEAIDWYRRKRKPKRWLAFAIRVVALAAAGTAALIPLISPMVNEWLSRRESSLVTHLDPLWISVALAIAAGAFAVDRAWGASSGWMRFVLVELKLQDALEVFELEWERRRAAWQGNTPTVDQVDAMLQFASAFVLQVNSFVQEETNAWVEEFRSWLRQLQESLASKQTEMRERLAQAAEKAERARESRQPAAVNITVSNYDKLDGGEWTLVVDDSEPRTFRTKKAGIMLPPGIHLIRVSGVVGQVAMQHEENYKCPAGEIVEAEITLG